METKNVRKSQWKDIAQTGRIAGALIRLVVICLITTAWMPLYASGYWQNNTALTLDTIFVSDTKTTAVLFPSAITMFDIGNDTYGGAKDDNLLRLKAAEPNAVATTLIVKYGDALYHGTIAYRAIPPDPFIDMKDYLPPPATKIVLPATPPVDSSALRFVKQSTGRLDIILADGREYFKEIAVKVPGERIALTLSNLRVDSANVYVKLLLINRSELPYHLDFTEFIYQDPLSQKELRGAYDRKNVYPICSNNVKLVPPKGETQIGFAIPRFAASKRADLLVVIHEKRGSRQISLAIPFKIILESKNIF